MNETGIVRNIRRLSAFIDEAYLKSEDDKFLMFQTDFEVFHHQIEDVYTRWFPNSKPCKGEDIVNRIFRNDIAGKDAKIWVKYSLACLLNSSKRIYDRALQIKSQEKDQQSFLCELDFLMTMAYEAAILMEIAFDVMEKRTVDFGYGKRFYIHPRETFNASKQILRKNTDRRVQGDFVVRPTSIFLIRQAIELWLQSIFGINLVLNEHGKPIPLQPERLFELLDSKGIKVEIPVTKAVIQKIHKWTQTYVHAGWLAYTWEIEHAQHILQPIFSPSNVKIERLYYDSIEDQIKEILRNPTLKLHRVERPSCVFKSESKNPKGD